MFSIAICRSTGDKWQSKTLFLSIVDNVFDCRLPGVINFKSDCWISDLRGQPNVWNYSIITFSQLKLEFREWDMSPGKTKAKQGKFVDSISKDERLF